MQILCVAFSSRGWVGAAFLLWKTRGRVETSAIHMSSAFSVWWCLETNRSLSGPPLDFHDKYSNIDRYRGRPGSCQLCLLAALINCFTISRPAGGPLLDHFCPPSGRRMEQAAECIYRQPPCAERVTSPWGKKNSFRHRAASCWLRHFICMLWRLNWDSLDGREHFGMFQAGGLGGEGQQVPVWG